MNQRLLQNNQSSEQQPIVHVNLNSRHIEGDARSQEEEEDEDLDKKVFSRYYKKELFRSSTLYKVAFFGFLGMEFVLSAAILGLCAKDFA